MTYHLTFLLLFIVGVAQFASAQTPQSIAPPTDALSNPLKDVRIVLETRWILLSDNFEERVGPDLEKLPKLGACAVCGKQQKKLLLYAASGDKRSNVESPTKTITVLSDEKRELLLTGRRDQRQGNDTIQATVSDDQQAIQIQLTWAKWNDGNECLPTTSTTVPMGSSLLVHTHTISEGRAPVSLWTQFADKLLKRKPKLNPLRLQQMYLMVSPRIALPGEKDDLAKEDHDRTFAK